MDAQDIDFHSINDSGLLVKPKHYYDSFPHWMKSPLIVLPFVFGTFIFFCIFLIASFSIAPPLGVIVVILLIALMAKVSASQARAQRNALTAAKQFAADNGWEFGDPSVLIEGYRGGNFMKTQTEHGARYKAINGSLNGHAFTMIFAYLYPGQPWNVYAPWILIDCGKQVPTAVLVSRKITDGYSMTDRLFVQFPHPVKVELEGDFDRYFQLYAPKGSETTTMELIAPDFMAAAVDYVENYTIELGGTLLSLQASADIPTKDIIINQFKAATELVSQINDH